LGAAKNWLNAPIATGKTNAYGAKNSHEFMPEEKARQRSVEYCALNA